MEEKVYPTVKPPPAARAAAAAAAQHEATPAPAVASSGAGSNQFQAPKARPYAAARPRYLPLRPPLTQKHSRRHRRGCCCCLCLLLCLLLIIAFLLVAIAGALFYALYHPHRPYFSVSSFKISQFNFTSASSSRLNFRSNFSIAIHNNNNKKLAFIYDHMPVLVKYEDVVIGKGDLPPLIQPRKNTTILSTSISPVGQDLDTPLTESLRSTLKKKETLTVTVQIDTGVRVKFSGFKTKRIKIRVSCGGIRVPITGGRGTSSASVKCKASVRIKIWKWTISK